MPTTATLNSRLRVLIARTYKAEKLYSSNARSAKQDGSGPENSGWASRARSSRAQNSGDGSSSVIDGLEKSLGDVANRARAKEWERAHRELREALNEVLALGTSKKQAAALISIANEFRQYASEGMAQIDRGIILLKNSAERQEFSHVCKISLELVKEKARIQANSIIAEEVKYLLSRSGKGDEADLFAPAASKVVADEGEDSAEEYQPNNVISLETRRAAGGRR